jgi:hypothetical protein
MPQADLVKRFTETSLETMLWLSSTNIRVQTNCQAVANQLGRALAPCTTSALDASDFVYELWPNQRGTLNLYLPRVSII